MDRMLPSELYTMAQHALRLIYNPDKGKELSIIRYQVLHYYPRMAPMLARWEEPLIQQHIKSYLKVMAQAPAPEPNNTRLELDPVYSHLVNYDLRRSIETRRMKESTYRRIEYEIQKDRQRKLIEPAASTELALRASTAVSTQADCGSRLDRCSPGLLAIESGLHPATVSRLKGKGFTGSAIVDIGFAMKDNETNSGMIQRLIKAGIEDWSSLISTAREIRLLQWWRPMQTCVENQKGEPGISFSKSLRGRGTLV